MLMNIDVVSSIKLGYRCSTGDVNFDANIDHPYDGLNIPTESQKESTKS